MAPRPLYAPLGVVCEVRCYSFFSDLMLHCIHKSLVLSVANKAVEATANAEPHLDRYPPHGGFINVIQCVFECCRVL